MLDRRENFNAHQMEKTLLTSTKDSITTYHRALVFISLLLLALLMPAPALFAQDTVSDFEPYPLRPADTSSPRDTLHSFRSNVKRVFDGWRQGEPWTVTRYRAQVRALQTLDFSTTPDGNSWSVRALRAVHLQEILNRIPLPPDDQIPGDADLEDGAIKSWTIPNTRITIRRIEDGPRAGEFLFSTDTVRRLDRFYQLSKHLPYQPDAMVGVYEAFTSSDRSSYAVYREIRNRLRPVDTSSPRSTLDGFLDSVNRAYSYVREANAALDATPPTMTKEEAREIERMADNLLSRARSTLDLSRIPEALRDSFSVEAALQLKEIFDRMPLPPVDSVPSRLKVEASREADDDSPLSWRYPSTEIYIVEIMEGERQGQFLFSADSVGRISEFYEKIRDLPYRSVDEAVTPYQRSPGKSEGFYESYISTPGYLIPHTNFLAGWIDDLPAWFHTLQGGQTLWQWIGLVLSVLVIFLAAYASHRFVKRLAEQLQPPWDTWLKGLPPVVIVTISAVIVNFLDKDLRITGDLLTAVTTGGQTIVFAMAAWVVYVFCKAIAETIIIAPRIRTQSSEAALLRIGARAIGFLLGAWILIDGIRELGADLIPLLAGLGVVGLAVSLAAQSTIANYIGGLILFANKPVRVGDFCRYGEDPSTDWMRIGTVEEIGLISTRLRGIDRTVTNIPNAEFANMHIVNLTARDQRLVRTTLQLRYETTPEQMRYVLTRLRELLLGHPMVTADPARVRFIGYGPYSKNVEIFAYLQCQEQNTFLAIQEDLFLRIEDIISDAGTGFAFPSQTAYLARDEGLDAERCEEAERDMQRRRATGKLPFPEFEEEERELLEDILDYPPKGSPNPNISPIKKAKP
ncbi:MAG: mechanosensitive ion channel [Gammaproteobacteria bacterium]|nr:mechanosensitive ion channel [Gammaproteobacteria bacterium]